MKEKKAIDIKVLNLKEINNSIADYFIICSGNSNTQLDAIANAVKEEVYKKNKLSQGHIEGLENKEWILIDYFDVVVHIFLKERREFYALEELWGDAKIEN